MKKSLLCLAAILGLCLCAAPATAKTYTISVTQIVEHPALDAVRNGFKDKLKEMGVSADYNEYTAQGDISTANQIASQILGDSPDLVLAIATPTAQAAAQKIDDIPIVITAVTDPVAAGLVASLEKPGANITGMTDKSPVDRQMDLIKEILPDTRKIGVIYNAGEANSVVLFNLVEAEAALRGWDVTGATVASSADVFQAAKSLVGRVDAVYIPTDNTVVSALESAIKVCAENDLPLFAADTDSVERGVLAALAIDYYRMGRQSAEMAKRILVDGANPATMPVESLKDLKLYINQQAAEAMDVELPSSVLQRADKTFK
jgi:putative ABC transport system substrate-binding protein